MAVAMGEVQRRVGDEGRGPVGRHIAEPRREMGLGPVGSQGELDLRRAEDLDILCQRRRIEAEGAPVLDPLIQRQVRAFAAIAAPAAAIRAGDLGRAVLEPGRFYRIRLKLNDIARRIPAGHRLRLALATAHWPIVWPAPDNATLSISIEGSRLILPQRPPRPEDADLPPFEPALAPPPIAYRETRPAKSWRRVTDDLGENLQRIEMGLDYGAGEILDIGIEDDAVLAEVYEISPDDPLSARARIEGSAGFASAGHRCRIETVTELSATRESFEIAAKIEAFEDGKPVFARSFRKSIPREFM